MTTFYRLKENGSILDYTEFDVATETTTQIVTDIEYKEVVEQEEIYDEDGNCTLQDVIKTIEVPVEREETVTIDHVPAFIRELYTETERKIIKLTDGSFAFEDEVNLDEEAKKKAEKEFNEAKQAKLQEIDSWTANKIVAGLVSDCVGYYVKYDSDRDTQDKLALALNLVNAGVLQARYPEGFPCRGYKQIVEGVFESVKTIHLFPANAVIQWNTEFGEHLKKCTTEGWMKQEAVNACVTIEEINAIVLE